MKRLIVAALLAILMLTQNGFAQEVEVEVVKPIPPKFGFGKIFQEGNWRTEFASPLVGTAAVPLQVTKWDSRRKEVLITEHVWPDSNAKTNNPGGWPAAGEDMIIITANNDNDDPSNPRCGKGGPPDQGSKITEVGGGGVFGVSVYGGGYISQEKIYRLEVNNNRQPCYGGLPYLGMGAFQGNGVGRPIGILNSKDGVGATTDFSIMLDKYALGKNVSTQPVSAVVHVMAVAEWGGRKYMLFVNVFSEGLNDHGSPWYWKWPYPQSPYFPGALVVTLNGPKMGIPYLTPQTWRGMSINWNDMFRYADDMGWFGEDRLPRDKEVRITHFQIALEISGMGENTNIQSEATHLVVSVMGLEQR